MADGFDIGAIIKATPGKILRSAILLILWIELKSLYNYFIKLDTIQEKQLMIDVMSLCQSYEQRKITKIK